MQTYRQSRAVYISTLTAPAGQRSSSQEVDVESPFHKYKERLQKRYEERLQKRYEERLQKHYLSTSVWWFLFLEKSKYRL